VNQARWSKGAEARFFAALAETANVEEAAEAAGFSSNAIYARRLRHPVFREKWAATVETARARLELGIIELAKRAIDDALAGVPAEGTSVTIAEALQILRLGAQPQVPTGPDGRRRLNAGAQANLRAADNKEIAEALAKRLVAFSKRVDREKPEGGDASS
jgi:ribosomal protein S4